MTVADATTQADLRIHPIRLSIIETVTRRPMTARQIAAIIKDVPQTTLYRHLNKLLTAGVLAVVAERAVRGTREKTYALDEQWERLTARDVAEATREDHLRYFKTFVASLLGDFARYLQRERVDLLADGVSYNKAPLHLTEEEFRNLRESLVAVLEQAAQNQPGVGRQPRILSLVFLPVAGGEDKE